MLASDARMFHQLNEEMKFASRFQPTPQCRRACNHLNKSKEVSSLCSDYHQTVHEDSFNIFIVKGIRNNDR